MRQLLKKTREVTAYVFHRKGFFTKKLVVGTVTLMMMLFLDIKCHIWDGMGMILLVLLTLYVVANYMVRYIEMRREDEEKDRSHGSAADLVEIPAGPCDETRVGEGQETEIPPSESCDDTDAR